MADGNGKPAGDAPQIELSKYTIRISIDVSTDTIEVDGLKIPPWIALGMLKYMENLVRRRDAENAMREMAKNAPRVHVPGGRL